jgi:hypothetical protein
MNDDASRVKRSPFFLLLILSFCLYAEAESGSVPQLSAEATVSLVTMWPGAEIYSAFGHSGFRVTDPRSGIDLLFNYGTFDFEDPLFVPRFVKGELNYCLSVYPYKAYYDFNVSTEKRRWNEQILDLDRGQVDALYRFLMKNALPENRYYRYDFIKDNCATRIDDALVKALGPSYALGKDPVAKPGASYRDLIDEYVAGRPLYLFLFSFVLGRASDHVVTTREASFAPIHLMKALDSATLEAGGSTRPLVRSSSRLYEPQAFSDFSTAWIDPGFLLWPLALLVLILTGSSILAWRKGRTARRRLVLADLVLFMMIGLAGAICFYLEFLSVHSATKGNLNLIWLWPFHFLAAWWCLSRRPSRLRTAYFGLAAIAALLPLLAWPLWPQGMDSRLIPLLLIVSARSLRLALPF